VSGTIAMLRFTDHGPYELVVREDGVAVAARAVSEIAPGPSAWDRALWTLGYAPVGDWQPWRDGEGMVCRVSGPQRSQA